MSKKKVDTEPTLDEVQTEKADADAIADAEVLQSSGYPDEGLSEGGPVELTLNFLPPDPVVEVVIPEHRIKVAINSLEFRPRGKAGFYRAGAAYVLKAEEALELIKGGVATLVEDPCDKDLTFPDLDPEVE